jgi:hypothetical protein
MYKVATTTGSTTTFTVDQLSHCANKFRVYYSSILPFMKPSATNISITPRNEGDVRYSGRYFWITYIGGRVLKKAVVFVTVTNSCKHLKWLPLDSELT